MKEARALLNIYNQRIDTAFKTLFKKFSLAENATDITRAVSEVENESLNDTERYLINSYLQKILPECFLLPVATK